jgi:single-stranded-DNA-specific exonuclease
LNHYRWNTLPIVPAEHPPITPALPPLICQLLYNRGITEPSQAELFISADKRLSFDPELLPDIHPAIARIYRALLSAEKIAVYGDFDTDGITGAALLTQGLEALGGQVRVYIPHRLKEGHGLNNSALEHLQKQGISLVVTVDCGVTGVSQVKKANQKGLDIVISDHHTPLDELPPAVAVIDPKRADSRYPFRELSGVGVAFKLLQALYQGMGREKQLDRFLDLVALGTVADMMPMLGENRYLVRQGLMLLNTSPRVGIKAMTELARLGSGSLCAEDISWILAPRLNAAGRLENAMHSYRLLTTDQPEEAYELAQELEVKNSQRQRLTTTAVAKARQQILDKGVSPLLVTTDREYLGGILGLVAGKLTEEFYRPSIAIKIGDNYCYGSCRSIPEFDIIQAISQCHSLLSQFGGHAKAAGFSLPTQNLACFQEQLGRLAATRLADLELCPRLDIDAQVMLDELNGDTFRAIQMLAPFGQGNPLPTFLSRSVLVADGSLMGNNGNHLRLKLKQGDLTWDAVAFGMGDRLPGMHSVIDIVYNLEMNKWEGEERLRLNILDLKLTSLKGQLRCQTNRWLSPSL